jgi:hypothetical protein
VTETQTVMKQLAVELARPKQNNRKIDELNKKLDQLLGTGLKDTNTEADEAWENGRR